MMNLGKITEFLEKPEVKEMPAGLEEIAQAVAVAVEDKALTQRIYEKSLEKFDGATNVLWMHLEADGKLKSQGGWNKRIDAELGKGRKNAIVKGIGNVDAAIKKFEKTVGAPLHLFWMYPSQWDKKTTPLVAFVPFDKDPETRSSIPAVDSKGNQFELENDGKLAKQRPVLVIAMNERTNKDGSIRSNVLPTNLATSFQVVGKNGATIQNHNTLRIVNDSISIYGARGYENEWEGQQEFFYSYVWAGTTVQVTNIWLGKHPNNVASFTLGGSGNTFDIVHPSVYFKYYEADGLMFDDWLSTHQINTDFANPNLPPLTAGVIQDGHPRLFYENVNSPSRAYVTPNYRLIPIN